MQWGGLLGSQELVKEWEDRSPTPKCSVAFSGDWSLREGRRGRAWPVPAQAETDRDSGRVLTTCLPVTDEKTRAYNSASVFFFWIPKAIKVSYKWLASVMFYFCYRFLKWFPPRSILRPYILLSFQEFFTFFFLCFTVLCILQTLLLRLNSSLHL